MPDEEMAETHPAPPDDTSKTPERVQSETLGKHKRVADADAVAAERAKEIRAIVRRADNRHLRRIVTPVDLLDEAHAMSTFHAGHYKADAPPCFHKTLPRGAVFSRSAMLEELVHFTQNGQAWLDILRSSVAQPDSAQGYSCLVAPLDWRFSAKELPTVRANLEEALRRCCKMPSITVIAPQRREDKDAPYGNGHAPPHVFLVRFISEECTNDLDAGHAHHVSWKENPAGIPFVIFPPDLPPPTHVATYDEIETLPELDEKMQSMVVAKVRAQIARHWDDVERFIRQNKTKIWGSGKIEPWSLDLVQESVRVQPWECTTGDGKKERLLSVYFLGVFDATWLHAEWEKTLLGDVLDLEELGEFRRRHGLRAYTCTICYEHDHHTRLCPIWYHPEWPEELRKAREDRLRKAREDAAAAARTNNRRGPSYENNNSGNWHGGGKRRGNGNGHGRGGGCAGGGGGRRGTF